MLNLTRHKLIRRLISKVGWQELTLFGLIALVLLPSLFVSWMIVDDGVSILNAQKISHFLSTFDFRGLFDSFIEKESGRFRPAYWFFYWFSYLLVGKSALGHHLIHLIVVGSTVYLIFSIINRLISSKTSALIASALFLLSSLNIENWYRLGPQEPLITLYLALSIYFLIKQIDIKNTKSARRKLYFFLSVLPLVPAYFTKETFIAFLPFSALLLIGVFWVKEKSQKKIWKRQTLYFFAFNVLLAISSILVSMFIRTHGYYSAYYSVSILGLVGSAKGYVKAIFSSYGIFAWIFAFSYLAAIVRLIIRKSLDLQQFKQIAFLVGGLSFFIIQLPWMFIMGRYLEPALLFFSIFFAFEIEKLLKIAKNISKVIIQLDIWDRETKLSYPVTYLKFIAVVFLFLIFFYINIPSSLNYVADTILGNRNIAKTLNLAARTAAPNSTVYMNLKKGDATIELVFESGLHMNLFYDRPDLTVEYLDDGNLNQLKKGGVVVTAIASSQFFVFREEEIRKENKIQTIGTINHSVYNLLFLPFPYKPVIKFVVLQRPLTLQHFLRYSSSQNQWKIYKVL
ncbi:MAG: glycosyltransferase family 39 protein [bacterium]|nr:glycosyltransferase family 39 protein [bacterium]